MPHRLQAGADEGDDVSRAAAGVQYRHLPPEGLLLIWRLIQQPLDRHGSHAVAALDNHPKRAVPQLHLVAVLVQIHLRKPRPTFFEIWFGTGSNPSVTAFLAHQL